MAIKEGVLALMSTMVPSPIAFIVFATMYICSGQFAAVRDDGNYKPHVLDGEPGNPKTFCCSYCKSPLKSSRDIVKQTKDEDDEKNRMFDIEGATVSMGSFAMCRRCHRYYRSAQALLYLWLLPLPFLLVLNVLLASLDVFLEGVHLLFIAGIVNAVLYLCVAIGYAVYVYCK